MDKALFLLVDDAKLVDECSPNLTYLAASYPGAVLLAFAAGSRPCT